MVSGVFKLGFQTPPTGCLNQLDPILAVGAALFLHENINQHVMVSQIARILHTLAKYTLGCNFYNQNMILLTENQFEETFQARIVKLINTKHEY